MPGGNRSSQPDPAPDHEVPVAGREDLDFRSVLFSGSDVALVALGALLWGIGMGAHESVLRAAIAGMIPPARRGTAYGIFNTGYGVAWFAGSAAMGVVYDLSLPALIALSVTSQALAIPILLSLRGKALARTKPRTPRPGVPAPPARSRG